MITSTKTDKCGENIEIKENERLIDFEGDNVAKSGNLRKQYSFKNSGS